MKYLLVFLFALNAFAESETMKGARKDADAFKREIQVRLDRLDQKIEDLKNQGQAQKSKAIQDLETTRAMIQGELQGTADTGKQSWKSWKRRLSTSVDDLNRRVQKVLSE